MLKLHSITRSWPLAMGNPRAITYSQSRGDKVQKVIAHKGFSVVEILPQCPTHYGRKNREGDAPQMLHLYRDNTARLGSKALDENPGFIARGIIVDIDRPEYCDEYQKVIERAEKWNR